MLSQGKNGKKSMKQECLARKKEKARNFIPLALKHSKEKRGELGKKYSLFAYFRTCQMNRLPI